jgi:hypothetical protein
VEPINVSLEVQDVELNVEPGLHHVKCVLLDGEHAGELTTIETNDAGLIELYAKTADAPFVV